MYLLFFFFNDTATTEIYTLSLHDALPILLPPEWAHFAENESRTCFDDWVKSGDDTEENVSRITGEAGDGPPGSGDASGTTTGVSDRPYGDASNDRVTALTELMFHPSRPPPCTTLACAR